MATSYPKFDGFSLQDDNYVMSEINYRTIPTRRLETDKILRRPGVKLMSSEFGQRIINMSGYIVADSISELREKIDNFHTNVTRKENGLLFVESDRSSNAIVDSVTIADPHYTQTYVPMEVQFLLADPFFYGLQQVVEWTVTSGVISNAYTITVSGSVFAEPAITYYAPDGSGYTTVSGIMIDYLATAERITWSGGTGTDTLMYGGNVTFDYTEHLLTENTTVVHPIGVYSRWEPGITNFNITFSGGVEGGTLQFAYQPRYL